LNRNEEKLAIKTQMTGFDVQRILFFLLRNIYFMLHNSLPKGQLYKVVKQNPK
jgi:hypothetical protein